MVKEQPIPLSTSKVSKVTLQDTLYKMDIIRKPNQNKHTFKWLVTYLFAFFCMVYYVQHAEPSTENASRIFQELEEEARKKED